jgi:hypothetical protein
MNWVFIPFIAHPSECHHLNLIMKQTKQILIVARPNVKLDVQRRESRDSAGYISYNLVPLYFRFLS